jgi:DNA-binding beta-propeller fold protein YncE
MTADITAGTLEHQVAPAPEQPPVAEVPPEEDGRRRRKLLLLLLLFGMLAVLIGVAAWYLLFRQPINPLPVIPETRLPAYSTSILGPDMAMGVAVSPDGDRIYAAETEGDRALLIYDANGTLIRKVQPPESTGSEHVPVWVAIDPVTSEVYVTDRPTGEIYVYDRDGAYQRTFVPQQQIAGWQPIGIAFDMAGNLYVSDLGGTVPRIEMFDRSGKLVRTFGEGSGLSFPNGVAIDKTGQVYVADSNNGRLLVFGSGGTLIAQVGRGAGIGDLGLPRGVSVDGQGRVYVCDPTAQGVHVYRAPSGDKPSLEDIGFFGGEGIDDGKFNFPNGVATDAHGRIYVTDTGNDRVQLWSY